MRASLALPILASPPSFAATLERHGQSLVRGRTRTLQLNLGKLCNMACTHCHVEAGPTRTEMMGREVADRVLELLARSESIELVDLTGGAPELNPHFLRLVVEARRLGRRVIDRSNLTVFFEPGQERLPEFLASEGVEVVASLPCYLPENVERQRGRGAYGKSIEALIMLNELGYGRPGSPLVLDLVYNPVGPTLPPPEAPLEARYKEELGRLFGIEFRRLLTITNMPIKRFAEGLERKGALSDYQTLLLERFNPQTVPDLMCRSLISVGFDGRLYDCDFNQMLELPLGGRLPRSIWELESLDALGGSIGTASHCFGCTAGHGSSCSGALG